MSSPLTIRKSTEDDIPALCALADASRAFMAAHGNAQQWGDGYPSAADFARDIKAGASHVCIDGEGRVVGTFAVFDHDDDYKVITNGRWLNDEPYMVMHRVAAYSGQGIGTFMIRYMQERCKNLRIDTRCTNVPMQQLLKKLGFVHCGTIVITGRGEREAFQWEAFHWVQKQQRKEP